MERAIYDAYNVQGMTVEYIDMGVEYTYMGKALQIIGEQDAGEVSISTEDEVLGYYERDEDTVTVTLRDGRTFTLDGNSEEDFENFALQMLV